MTKKEQYIYLREKGWTYAKIAREYGVTPNCVRYSVNYKKTTQPRPKLKQK